LQKNAKNGAPSFFHTNHQVKTRTLKTGGCGTRAFGKKKVQLIPVADQNQADYVITGTSVDKKAGWAKIAFMGNVHSDNAASITMADRRTGAIVYACAVDKKSTLHGQQTTAEACAKHLEAHIEGHN
jgi:hypothetical protein